MIRSLYYTAQGDLHIDLEIDQLNKALADAEGLLWVDFENTRPEDDEPILSQVFGFHPLAIDDALQESHVPKVDDWGEYLYIVLQAITLAQSDQAHLET